jgi:hypothetical protein
LQATALLQSKLAAQQAVLAGRDQQRGRGTAATHQEVGMRQKQQLTVGRAVME